MKAQDASKKEQLKKKNNELKKRYLHIGADTVVKNKEIIGIFDIDRTTVEKNTRDFLRSAQSLQTVTNVTRALPKSFVVCCGRSGREFREQELYITQLNPKTLYKRTIIKETVI